MAGRSLSRSLTLSEAARERPKIRFNLPVDDSETRHDLLTAATNEEGSGSTRTLMDIIREEQQMHGSGSGSIRDEATGTINWKSFKDRIRLRRAGNAFTDPDQLPGSSASSGRESIVSEYDPNPNPSDGGEEEEAGGGAPVSLMALLGQFGEEEEEEEETEMGAEEKDEEEGGEYTCCVCMVRHKGAAFIPCGHTFCRLCSRELWVSRGNCPLCNGFILEILDIF